jgi:hypothetical protein
MSKERFLKEISLNRESKQLEKKAIFITEQKANEIIQQFQYNIKSIREKFHIYDELVQNGKEEHAKDILRSQVVFLMSALDFYMHEMVRYRLLKMFSGELSKTESYKLIIKKINQKFIVVKVAHLKYIMTTHLCIVDKSNSIQLLNQVMKY